MRKTNVEYGIDLGTTNSSIAVFRNGKIEVMRNPMNQKEVMPSCVYFYKRRTVVGDKAKNQMERDILNEFRERTDHEEKNWFVEFKRSMGYNEEYLCQNREEVYSPEKLSAEVLKELVRYTDDDVKTAIITVPMRFKGLQYDATKKAAELAGFEYSKLLQEPIAAAIAFGMEKKNLEGYFLVFDFGGGTFDIALMHLEDGIMEVIDSGGDNHLGGKDIDKEIVEEILIPKLKEKYDIGKILENKAHKKLLKNMLKNIAEEIKIMLSTRKIYTWESEEPIDYDEVGEIGELDIEITRNQLEEKIHHILQRSIDITNELLKNNNVKGNELQKILLVGGTTLIPKLRSMVKEQIADKLDYRIDPLTAVSQGAALHAFTVEIPDELQAKKSDRKKFQVKIEYPKNTVENEINVGIKLLRKKIEGEIPEDLLVEIIRNDRGWSSGKLEIYSSKIIEILLIENTLNTFKVEIFDNEGSAYTCEPESFEILHGMVQPEAILPQSICIGVLDEEDNVENLLKLKGLEKNTKVKDYVIGDRNFKTNKDIRPDNENDKIRIPIYEGEENTRKVYNDKRAEIIITGKDISTFLPKDSDIEITLKINNSLTVAELIAFLPDIGETVKKKAELELYEESPVELERMMRNAEIELEYFKDRKIKYDEKLERNLKQIQKDFGNDREDIDTRRKTLDRIREVHKEIDKVNANNKFPKLQKEITELLKELRRIEARYGNEKTEKILNEYNMKSEEVFNNKDIKIAREFIKELRAFRFAILRTRLEYWMNIIKYYDDNFDECSWINETEARNKIQEAKDTISEGEPTAEKLEHITFKLWDLLEDDEEESKDKSLEELLKE